MIVTNKIIAIENIEKYNEKQSVEEAYKYLLQFTKKYSQDNNINIYYGRYLTSDNLCHIIYQNREIISVIYYDYDPNIKYSLYELINNQLLLKVIFDPENNIFTVYNNDGTVKYDKQNHANFEFLLQNKHIIDYLNNYEKQILKYRNLILDETKDIIKEKKLFLNHYDHLMYSINNLASTIFIERRNKFINYLKYFNQNEIKEFSNQIDSIAVKKSLIVVNQNSIVGFLYILYILINNPLKLYILFYQLKNNYKNMNITESIFNNNFIMDKEGIMNNITSYLRENLFSISAIGILIACLKKMNMHILQNQIYIIAAIVFLILVNIIGSQVTLHSKYDVETNYHNSFYSIYLIMKKNILYCLYMMNIITTYHCDYVVYHNNNFNIFYKIVNQLGKQMRRKLDLKKLQNTIDKK